MTEAPDGSGRFFIVEQTGRSSVQKGNDGSKPTNSSILSIAIPSWLTKMGLLSIAFHPGFKTNGLCYIYYNQRAAHKHAFIPYRSVISELKVSATIQIAST